MVATTQGMTEAEKELVGMMERWEKAVTGRDLDGLMSMYCPEVALFDVKPPFLVKGRKAYREMWEQCLPHMPKKFGVVRKGLEVMVGGEIGFLRTVCKFTSDEEGHPACVGWVRVTVCYKKVEGKWFVVHEHVSLPFDPMSGRVVGILDGDVEAAGL